MCPAPFCRGGGGGQPLTEEKECMCDGEQWEFVSTILCTSNTEDRGTCCCMITGASTLHI